MQAPHGRRLGACRFGCGAQCDRLRGKPAFPHRRAIFAGHRAAAGQIHAASAREFYRKSSHFENAFLLRAMGTHRDEIHRAAKKAVRKARNVRDKTEIEMCIRDRFDPLSPRHDALYLTQKFFLLCPHLAQFIAQARQTHLLIHSIIISYFFFVRCCHNFFYSPRPSRGLSFR